MDIAHLLTPGPEPLRSMALMPTSCELSSTSSSPMLEHEAPLGARRGVSHTATPARTRVSAKRSLSATSACRHDDSSSDDDNDDSARAMIRALQAAVATTALPVKRKRKRRLTAKQLQAAREHQLNESQLLNLTLDINDLKQQVRDYLVRKSVHETRTLVHHQRYSAGVLRTTQQFFHIFRTGFRDWAPPEAAFLHTTVAADVVLGHGVRGSYAFFEQWRRYKQLLLVRRIDVRSMAMIVSEPGACVVECEGEFEGRLTRDAIAALFPHILYDQALLNKVVNCRLVCPTRTLLYFDVAGSIVQYDAHADFFAGLNRILAADPMDVITLMSNARISAEGSMLPDVDDCAPVESLDCIDDDSATRESISSRRSVVAVDSAGTASRSTDAVATASHGGDDNRRCQPIMTTAFSDHTTCDVTPPPPAAAARTEGRLDTAHRTALVSSVTAAMTSPVSPSVSVCSSANSSRSSNNNNTMRRSMEFLLSDEDSS